MRCALCNRPREELRLLVAGPTGAAACEDCIDRCAEALAERRSAEDVPVDGTVLDPVAWYRRVLHEGRGKTVMTCNGPGHHVGFVVYDEPDSPWGRTFWTPMHAARARLPEHVLAAISTAEARMALCHLITVGGAPPL